MIKGEKAGTALRTMFTNLSKPTKAMKTQMDELGISITDSNGEMLPMRDVMDQLRNKFKGLSKDQKASAAATIFGKESMSGALAIINASQKDYDKLSKSIDNSEGSAKKMGDTMEKGLGGSLRSLKSAAQELGLSVFDTVQPVLSGMVGGLKSVVDFMNKMPKGAKVASVAIMGVAAAIGPVTLGVGLVAGAIAKATKGFAALNRQMAINSAEATINAKANGAVATSITTSGKRTKGSIGLFNMFGKTTGKAKGKVGLLGEATKFLGGTLKTTSKALNFIGGPIGLLITGTTLLGGAFVKAYKNVEWFRNGIDGLGNIIKVFGGGAINGVKKLGSEFSKAGSKIKSGFFDKIKKDYNDLDNDDLLKRAGDGFKSFMKTVGTASDKATDSTKVLGKGVSKETKNALDNYVKYSEQSSDILSDVKNNHGVISQEKANELLNIEQKLNNDLQEKFQKRRDDEIANVNNIYRMSVDLNGKKAKLTEVEYQNMLQKTEEGNQERIKKEQELNDEIYQMKQDFLADGHLDKEELKKLTQKENERNKLITESLTKSEKEQQKILDRMDSNKTAYSIKQASRDIKDAEKARKSRKDEIDGQYTDKKIAIQQNEDLSKEDKEKQLAVLDEWKKEELQKADDKKKEVVGKVKEQNKDVENEMDLSNGKVYSNSEKWSKKFGDTWNNAIKKMGDNAQDFKANMGEVKDTIGGHFSKLGSDSSKATSKMSGNFENFKGTMSEVGMSIGRKFKKLGSDSSKATSKMGGNFKNFKGTMSEVGKSVSKTTSKWFDKAYSNVKSNVNGIYNKTRDKYQDTSKIAGSKSKSVWKSTSKWFGKTYSSAKTKFKGIYDRAKEQFSSTKGIASSKSKSLWKSTSKWFGKSYSNVKGNVKGIYEKARDRYRDTSKTANSKSKSVWNGTQKWFGKAYESVKDKTKGIYNQAKEKYGNTSKTANSKSHSVWKNTSKWFGKTYSSVKDRVSGMLGKSKKGFGNIATEGWKKAKSVYKGFTDWFGKTLKWIKNISKDFGRAAGDLGRNVANKAIGGLNGMIGGVNKISKAITGKKQLIKPITPLSTGTIDGSKVSTDSNGGLKHSTTALVNDKGPGNAPGGGTQELIEKSDGSLYAPKGKNVLLTLDPGDKVHNAYDTQKYKQQGLISRFHGGTKKKKKDIFETISDGIKDVSGGFKDKASKTAHGIKDKTSDLMESAGEKIKDGASWLGDKIGDVWDYVKHPGKLVNKVMDSMNISFGGGNNATVDLVKGAYKHMKNSLVDKVKSWFDDFGGEGDASWLFKHDIWQRFGKYNGLNFNGGHHYGMDFGMKPGTPVYAVKGGKARAFDDYGGGHSVEIKTGANEWNWYMHLSKQIAKTGEQIKAGQLIAKSGNTGAFTAGSGHLHFQLMQGDHPGNDTAKDPEAWLKSLSGGGQNKSASKWAPEIKKAAGRMGVSLKGNDLNDVISLINTESNGNAGVTQQIQDQNSGGNEAQGLLQYTPGTFGSYAVKGHKNIKNGYDQLLAFFNNQSWRGNLNAWKSRMASGLTGWGPTGLRKYENGGIVTKHQIAEIGEKNRAEAIIPLHKSKRGRAVRLMEQAMTAIGMDNGPANVTVNNDNSTMEKLLKQVVQLNDTNNRMQQTIIKLLSGNNNNMSKNDVMNIFSQLLGNKANLDNFSQGF